VSQKIFNLIFTPPLLKNPRNATGYLYLIKFRKQTVGYPGYYEAWLKYCEDKCTLIFLIFTFTMNEQTIHYVSHIRIIVTNNPLCFVSVGEMGFSGRRAEGGGGD